MKTILDHLEAHASRQSSAPAYFARDSGDWRPTSFKTYFDQVRTAAKALMSLGVEPGSSVGVLSFNRPEWAITALAASATGAASVGIYTTSAAEQIAFILDHAEAKVVVVETLEHWLTVEISLGVLPNLVRVVMIEESELPQHPMVVGWSEFLGLGLEVPDRELSARTSDLEGHELAALIYTSGTTGPPKGVMLSHQNIVDTSRICAELLGTSHHERALSYLPMAHIAEQVLTLYLPVVSGYPVYYAQSLDAMLENLKEVRPTLFFGVPRVWEKMYLGMSERMRQTSGLKRRLASWAMRVGKVCADRRNEGRTPRWGLRAREYWAERLVHRRVRRALGVDQVRVFSCGAAPIDLEILEFFSCFGIVLREVYGQSEVTGPTTWNRPGRTRFGSVGPPIPEVEVQIAEDGEIRVRGPNVFLGYFKEPEATAEVLSPDGWLCSGDLGHFDHDGYLVITGRKKDIMITSGGKNLSPQWIEGLLRRVPWVGDAVLVADGRPFVSALISVEESAASDFAAMFGVAPEDLYTHHKMIERVAAEVAQVNRELSRVEQVKVARLLPRPLSLEHGELTPTLKVKRRVVMRNHQGLIEDIYRKELEIS